MSVFPICTVTLSGCGRTLTCLLHCPEDVLESCLLLRLYGFLIYSETCLSLLLLYFLGSSLFHLFCSFDLSLSTSRKGFEVNDFAVHNMRGEEEGSIQGTQCIASQVINIATASLLLPLPYLLKYWPEMNKAGQMPEPKAAFYLLQFPSNFLCRQSLTSNSFWTCFVQQSASECI